MSSDDGFHSSDVSVFEFAALCLQAPFSKNRGHCIGRVIWTSDVDKTVQESIHRCNQYSRIIQYNNEHLISSDKPKPPKSGQFAKQCHCHLQTCHCPLDRSVENPGCLPGFREASKWRVLTLKCAFEAPLSSMFPVLHPVMM